MKQTFTLILLLAASLLCGQKPRLVVPIGHTDFVTSVAFSPDGKTVLTGSVDKTAKLWDLSGSVLHTFKSYGAVAFSPDGKTILTGSFDGTASLWDLSGRELQCFEGHAFSVSSVAFSPDGKTVLTGSDDNTAKLWDLKGRREIQSFSGHVKYVTSVAFSPACPADPGGGKTVLTGSYDKTAKLWDLEERREIQSFSGHGKYVTSVAFSPACPADPGGGKTVLTGSVDSTAKLWDLEERREIQSFSGHADAVESVAFSPDGKTVLTGGRDKTAKLWYLNGQEIHSFSGHNDRVMSVAFSPACPADPGGGKTVLTGSWDNTTKFWDTKSRKLLATLIAIDSNDWVVTTPSGLFDASPCAMNLMYYVVDYVGEKIILDLEQLKARYWQPGLLSTLMGYNSNTLKNVGAFDNLALFPAIEAHIVEDSLFIGLRERNGGLGKLSLFLNNKRMKEDINPQGLKTLSFDLREFSSRYRLDTITTISLVAFEAKNYIRSNPFRLPYQPSVGKRGEGGSNTREKALPCRRSDRHLYVLVVGTSHYPPGEKSLPLADYDAAKIYEALVGTGKELYEDRIHAKLLSTEGAEITVSTKANIQATFESFSRFETFFREATPCDVLVVFFAGHGATWGKDSDQSNFYYLTKDISSSQLNDEEARKAFAISDEELTEWLANFPGEYQLLILDACNSGKAAETMGNIVARASDPDKVIAFDMMNGNTGSFVLTGTAPDMPAYESNIYDHGLLTYSLLDGMSGNALSEGRYVDVKTLLDHANKKVPILAQSIGYEQHPIIARPKGNSSFSLGIKTSTVVIELKQPKPMVIRSSFVDKDSLDDALGLTDAINDLFHAEKRRGNQALWVYQDTPKNANGFSLKGVYWTNPDGTVTLKGKLKKGDKEIGEPFELNGSKDPALLAKLIHKKVKDWILGK